MQAKNILEQRYTLSLYSLAWGMFTVFFTAIFAIAFCSIYTQIPYTKFDMYLALISIIISMVFFIIARKADREKV